MKIFVYFWVLVIFTSQILAHDLYRPSSFYALGGAAFIDYTNSNSIFINPANLKYLEKDTKIKINSSLISSLDLNDYVTVFFGSDPSGKVTSESDLQVLANSNKYLRIANSISYSFSDSYAILLEGNWTADTTFGKENPIAIDMFSAYDISLGFLYNLELYSISMAITPKVVYRTGINGLQTAADLNTEGILPSLGTSNRGLAVTADLGFIKKFKKTSYSLNFKNLGTSFILMKNSTNKLPILPMYASLSVKTTYPISKNKISSFFAIKKYFNYTESSLLNMFHLGLEFNFTNTLFLRGGFMNTSYTYGIGVRYWLLELSIASFVEDSSMFANDTSLPWAKNRRYVLELSLYI